MNRIFLTAIFFLLLCYQMYAQFPCPSACFRQLGPLRQRITSSIPDCQVIPFTLRPAPVMSTNTDRSSEPALAGRNSVLPIPVPDIVIPPKSSEFSPPARTKRFFFLPAEHLHNWIWCAPRIKFSIHWCCCRAVHPRDTPSRVLANVVSNITAALNRRFADFPESIHPETLCIAIASRFCPLNVFQIL